MKQNADNYTNIIAIDSYYRELTESRIGKVNASDRTKDTNTTALNLQGFIDSVKANGGYYIARYEASYGTDGKANSKISIGTPATTAPTTRVEGMLWNYVSEIDAATSSRNLYNTATTDLINSYAWDTALVYIKEISGDTEYLYKNGKSTMNSSIANTGDNKDEVCKINDIASNMLEYTTEYSNYIKPYDTYSISWPTVVRGGCYYYDYVPCGRYSDYAWRNSFDFYGFRFVLYM